MTPEVSVIVPIYNVERYLRRCVDSVIAQTYSNWELLCVDDNSPDGCAKLLAEYAGNDERIRVLSRRTNGGLSGARNMGMAHARGKYISFLDADDSIHPQLLEATRALSIQHDADVVAYRYEKVAEDFEPPLLAEVQHHQWKHKVVTNPLQYRRRRGRWAIQCSACTMLYKREVLDGLSFAPILFEDYPYTVKVLLRRPKTVIMQELLYYYTDNRESIMTGPFLPEHIADYGLGLADVWDACKEAPEEDREHVLREIFPDILKQVLNRIRRSPQKSQPPLWREFSTVLRQLDALGCLQFQGHKITRWLRYMKLLRSGG